MLAASSALPKTVPMASLPARREQEVLQLVADGLTTRQVADQLFTSKCVV